MTPRITNELRDAVQHNAGKPLEVEDDQHQVYVLMTRDAFERVVYDDSDLSEYEMSAAAQLLVNEDDEQDRLRNEGDGSGPLPS
jgi:hypothetical protein